MAQCHVQSLLNSTMFKKRGPRFPQNLPCCVNTTKLMFLSSISVHHSPYRSITHPTEALLTLQEQHSPYRSTTHPTGASFTLQEQHSPYRSTTHPTWASFTLQEQHSPYRSSIHPAGASLTQQDHHSPYRSITHPTGAPLTLQEHHSPYRGCHQAFNSDWIVNSFTMIVYEKNSVQKHNQKVLTGQKWVLITPTVCVHSVETDHRCGCIKIHVEDALLKLG